MAFEPAPGRYVVRVEVKEKTESGIYLPDSAKDQEQVREALVTAANWNDFIEDGVKASPLYREGDKVAISKYGGQALDDNHLIVHQRDILGVWRD